MADYFPLLARAISGLPDQSRDAREVIYARARKALLSQLRGAEPPLRAEDIAREQGALEDAIRRLEAEQGGDAVDDAPFAPVEVETPAVAPAPPSPAERAPVRPPFTVTRTVPEPDDSDPYADLAAETERRPPAADWRSEAAAIARASQYGTARPAAREEAFEPAIDTAAGEDAYPPAFEDEPRRRGRGPLIAGLIVLVLLVAGGFVGYLKRDTLMAMVAGTQSAAPEPSVQDTSAPAAPDVAKSNDRIAQAPPDNAQRSAAPAQAPAAPAAGQGVGVAQRAVLFEESAGGGDQGLQQFVGNVVWGTETFSGGAGQAPDIGITARIDIPDRGIKATLRIRRNQDASIPASHIIEAQFELPPNFDLGNVSSVPGMRAKASQGAQGVPLTGLAVRVAPGYFLIGLSALEAERQRNLGLLITRNFLDMPLVFENGRRAILVLEKGVPGDQAFRQTYSNWGLPLPPQPPQQ